MRLGRSATADEGWAESHPKGGKWDGMPGRMDAHALGAGGGTRRFTYLCAGDGLGAMGPRVRVEISRYFKFSTLKCLNLP